MVCDQGPTGDDKITHAGTAIAHVTTPEQVVEDFQTVPGACRLGERDTGPDIATEPVFLLSDELEVNTSVAIQEPCDVRCAARFHFAGLPSVLPSSYSSV
jgi:hypothetical protein